MTNATPLSTDAKRYLCCYYRILDEMTQSITAANLTHSISHNCIVQMIPHHRAAVQMSENILHYAQSQPVRCLAQRIAADQAQGITDMEAVLPACCQQNDPQADLRLFQRRTDLIVREMSSAMGAAPENNRLSTLYLLELLPHHRGAARMAENALKYDVSLELVPMLRDIIRRQCRQAAQIRTMLRRMGCQGTN